MITPTFARAQASAIRSSSVTTKTPETPFTRRAASTLRWISGFATPVAPVSGAKGLPGNRDDWYRAGIRMTEFIEPKSPGCWTVVDVEDANRFLALAVVLHHEQSRDLIFVEKRERVVDKVVGPDSLGIAGHELSRTVI